MVGNWQVTSIFLYFELCLHQEADRLSAANQLFVLQMSWIVGVDSLSQQTNYKSFRDSMSQPRQHRRVLMANSSYD